MEPSGTARRYTGAVLAMAAVMAAGSASLSACATSCAADTTTGTPGVIVDYAEVAAAHSGILHGKACFGTVCQESDSGQPLGPKIVIPLANNSSPATPLEVTVTSGSTVVLDTRGTFTVPRVSDGAPCGDAKQWQLNLSVRDGKLSEVPPSSFVPARTASAG